MKKSIWKRKWFIALLVFLSVVLIGASVVLALYWDLLTAKPKDSILGSYYGLFGYAPQTGAESFYIDYSQLFATYNNEIQAGINEGATNQEKTLAAYIIYRIACLSNATALQKAKYSVGSGVATGNVFLFNNDEPLEVKGGLNLNATYYDLLYPFEQPINVADVYDNYMSFGVSEEYTQIPQGAVSSNREALTRFGEMFLMSSLPFARRSIYDDEKKTIWNGEATSCEITETRSIANFKTKSRSFKTIDIVDSAHSRVYGEDWGDPYGSTAQDLSIHIINTDTIIPSTVVITKHIGADIAENPLPCYSVTFEIDTEQGRGTSESATYYAEQLYLAEAPSAFTAYLSNYHMYYTYLKVSFSVFNNGYLRTWGTDETWEMYGEVTGIATATITSNNNSTEAFCYDYDTIMQGFVNRYFGDMNEVNRPRSALPFDDLLSEFEPQAYGDYR